MLKTLKIFMQQMNSLLLYVAKNMRLAAYPIGSIYMSLSSTDPSTLFGGTWVQIKDTFLLAAGSSYSAGSSGGEAVHTLTVNEMPRHTHPAGSSSANPYFYSFSDEHQTDTAGNLAGEGRKFPYVPASGNIADTTEIRAAGGGASHNNMPPYYTVYMWRRTA